MTLYGWWHWQKKNQAKVLVSVCSKKDWFIVTCIVVALWLLFYTLLLQTNSKVPIADSFVSATACAGMWLLAKRKIENWLVLNVSNFMAIPLFYTKGLYVTMLLTVFLFFVAIWGFLHWRKLHTISKAEEMTAP
jgi:nicotinamide mononucleotide transporter